MAIAIAVLLLGAIKLADAAANALHIYRASRNSEANVDWAWTPVFGWTERRRKGLKDKKGLPALLLSVCVDFVFRAPVMASLAGGAVLLAVGTIHGTRHGASGRCTFSTIAAGADGWLNVAAGAMAVLVGMVSIFAFLQAIAMGSNRDPRTDAGQYLGRSQGKGGRKLLDPVSIALGTIISLFIAFAALYTSLIAMHGSWVAASPCRLGPLDLIYFSSSAGATVGFGDISPTSSVLRLVATTEIVVFFGVLALFLQALWINPKPNTD